MFLANKKIKISIRLVPELVEGYKKCTLSARVIELVQSHGRENLASLFSLRLAQGPKKFANNMQ